MEEEAVRFLGLGFLFVSFLREIRVITHFALKIYKRILHCLAFL